MLRSGSVGEILYSDALNREEKLERIREASQASINEKSTYTLKTSDKVIGEKLSKEFEEVCMNLGIITKVDD